jgi:hypothetical protein
MKNEIRERREKRGRVKEREAEIKKKEINSNYLN